MSTLSRVLTAVIVSLVFLGQSPMNSAEIVVDGKAVIRGIVVPEAPCDAVTRAADELVYYLRKAADVEVPIIRETETDHGGNYLFLGDCRATRSVGIVSSDYPNHAGVILIGSNAVYMAGNDATLSTGTQSLGTLFAVYEFLEKHLGVRWLWPGELGEVIPHHDTLVLEPCRENVAPKLASSRWRTWGRDVDDNGWSENSTRDNYREETRIWLDRHRFSFDSKYNLGHSFEKYFERFGESHPEFFNLLPDGTRRGNPYSWNKGAGKYISMCVTCPGLVTQILDDWQAASPRPSIINVSENDTSGYCVCENCLVADNSPRPTKERREKATAEFIAENVDWVKELGSVSDRYCAFWRDVQNAADKIEPGHTVGVSLYANYSEPPSQTMTLNDRFILRFTPPIMAPFNDRKVSEIKRIWEGWSRTGAQMMFRPNFTHVQCFPIMYHDEFYDIFTFAYKHGMAVTDMDSL
ncbi:MAG: DUF4838 domain-containing protein, partial [Lentisphaerae bacterium]|nr:DUF4838 domain-containing protein [Lentisphaerota bacterium]